MKDCIFCQIVREELPARFVYKDDDFVVFHDINPQSPKHVLVVPKKHIVSVEDIEEEDQALFGKMFLVIKKVADKLKVSGKGFKLMVNNGRDAGQIVDHLHIHLLGGWKEKKEVLIET